MKLKKRQEKLRQEVLANAYDEDTKELMLDLIEEMEEEFDDANLARTQVLTKTLTESEDRQYLLDLLDDALESEDWINQNT